MSFKVNNEELKQELIKYINTCEFKDVQDKNGNWKRKIKTRGYVSPKLGQMIYTIAKGLATKGNWRGYTWKEDFIAQAMEITLKYMHNFNSEKSGNAHGYINMICSHAFLQYTQKENKHGKMKQKLYDRKGEFSSSTDDEIAIDYESVANKKAMIEDLQTDEEYIRSSIYPTK